MCYPRTNALTKLNYSITNLIFMHPCASDELINILSIVADTMQAMSVST